MRLSLQTEPGPLSVGLMPSPQVGEFELNGVERYEQAAALWELLVAPIGLRPFHFGVDPFWWAAYELADEVFAMAKPHPPNPPTDVPPPAANGEGVRCPRCGNTDLLRIHRRLLDRLLSLVRPVYRFRCADPRCAWEGNVPQKWFSSDRYRRHYLR